VQAKVGMIGGRDESLVWSETEMRREREDDVLLSVVDDVAIWHTVAYPWSKYWMLSVLLGVDFQNHVKYN